MIPVARNAWQQASLVGPNVRRYSSNHLQDVSTAGSCVGQADRLGWP
jgi:hypothetical protein